MLRVGVPASLATIVNYAGLMALTAVVARLGTAHLAAYGRCTRFDILLMSFAYGVATAVLTLVGLASGARRPDRARVYVLRAGVCIVGLLSVPAAVLWWSPGLWMDLFSSDPAVHEVGTVYFRLVGPSYPFVAVSMVLSFAFQGLGRATVPLVWLVVRVVGVLGAAIVCGRLGLDDRAVFTTVAVGNVLSAVVMVALFVTTERRLRTSPSSRGGLSRRSGRAPGRGTTARVHEPLIRRHANRIGTTFARRGAPSPGRASVRVRREMWSSRGGRADVEERVRRREVVAREPRAHFVELAAPGRFVADGPGAGDAVFEHGQREPSPAGARRRNSCRAAGSGRSFDSTAASGQSSAMAGPFDMTRRYEVVETLSISGRTLTDEERSYKGAMGAQAGRPACRCRALLSIGALSCDGWWKRCGRGSGATGFRRPVSSGHRAYPVDSVPRLRRIAAAFAQGHGPATPSAPPMRT